MYEAARTTKHIKVIFLTSIDISGITNNVILGDGHEKKNQTYKIKRRQCNFYQQLIFDKPSLHQTSRKFIAQTLKIDNVMQITIIKAVNFTRSKGLILLWFQDVLESMDADYGDIIYFSEGKWLSWVEMLKRLYDL